jgi:arylsulfatase A-like enzyme
MFYNKYFPFAILLTILLASCRQDVKKPNIVLILADDMGYSDLGCTGSEIQTPNLDKLANRGLLFTHCYNTSRCCPTRASLLTGLYQHQAGYGHMDSDLGYPSYQGRFREGVVTIAQLLKQADYRNIMIGKWHLGHEAEFAPLARGFDRMYGIPKGGGVYFYPCIGRDRQVYLNDEQVFPDSSWYSTDAFTDYAMQFAKEAKEDKKPFFMYLAYIAPHFPLQARQEDIDKYRGKYSEGYGFYRDQRFQKQKELGVIHKSSKLSPPDFKSWEDVENKEEEDLKMAVYAAQVDRMDQNIGRLTSMLAEMGELDNTIILFMSDNGAVNVGMNDTPDAELGSRNSWAAYGQSWGNVSNTPYRYYKRMTHEGGVVTPLIVHWPEGLAKDGQISHEPVHIIDIMPTLLEIAGATYPPQYKSEKLIPLQGNTIVPLFNGGKQDPEKEMYWEHEGNQAVRIGNMKLVRRYKQDWELYNLKEDPTELNNVVADHPDLNKKLKAKWDKWAENVGVMDWPVRQ